MKEHQHHETTGPEPSATFTAQDLRGIFLPLPTPFNHDAEVDLRALANNVAKWNRTGVGGYVMLGSTGERVHLEEQECLSVVEAARRVVPQEMAFIVGAGRESVRATIAEVRRVAEAGADAVLVITPHFYRGAMTQSALSRYYMMVADSAPLPLLLYSMPELTGIALAPETVAQLSKHENIVGIKDSAGDIINFAETLRLVPEDFAVLTGSGPLLYAALCAGAWGGILAVGCVAPLIAVRIYEAVKAGEHERAQWLQQRLAPLALAVTKRYGIGGLKAALDRIGYTGGRVRAPLEEPAEDARREIARTLEACGSVAELTGSGEEFRQAGAAE